ncbi:MAG TPA: chemotaxis protein CheA [Candidatus Saccharimonadales bacterium]|nr:chemotaxis protein CheA [Candidatus Saccharimonadales bacterium]
MNEEKPAGLDAELLDDFFAEADEHLLGIRQALLHLETSVGKAQADPKIIEDLFRNFHSFKGISAIVGLGPAEAVAHATEDFLRLMRGGKAQLTAKGLEVLVAATQKLVQLAAAFRARKPLPGYESLLADLRQQCDSSSESAPVSKTLPRPENSPDTALLTKIEEARSRGLLLWKYIFSPSRESKDRGVNVNTVREQLAKAGEILKATPLVKSQGVIEFEFLVAAQDTPTDIAEWEAKGVTVQIAEQEEAAPKPLSPAEAPTLEEETHNPFLAPSHVVRVDLKRLDDLMRITGEMVIHRSRLDAQLGQLHGSRVDLRGVQEVSSSVARSLRELREAIMRVRLVPVAEIFARMPFVVRDLSRQTQKQVRLKLSGQETAIDKYLIERLKDPLLHLVRNAFSHGVETLEERTAASKPAEATIELSAATVGDSVILKVRDDGRGINPNAILRQARKLGLEVPDVMDNAAILKILCASGFSTREDTDRVAGRGVGMAVVYSTVRELGGNLTLESEEGRGTQFNLRLPLTLAIAETLIVRAAGQTCAIPQSFVREILHATEAQIQIVNGIEAISYRAGVLPIVRLAGLFQLKSAPKPKMCVLVITSERGSVGLLTDDILGQREVVVRALRDPLIQVVGITGATELGDGKPVLILDGAALTSGSVRPEGRLDMSEQTN